MSFFDEIVNCVDVVDDDFSIKIILNKCVYLCGIFKIIEFNKEMILISIKNKNYKIIGFELNIKTLAKNELFIQGNVIGFVED